MPIADEVSRREYMKEWSRQRRIKNRKFIQEYKVSKGCMDCGYNEHHAGLEFDHVGEKLNNVASLAAGSTKRLLEEIEKCDVVCGTCHGIRTWNRAETWGDYLSQ